MRGRRRSRLLAATLTTVVIAAAATACGTSDQATAPDFSYNAKAIDPSNMRPFPADSVWNRRVPDDARYLPVGAAIFGDPTTAPAQLATDLITVCATDAESAAVDVRQSVGWSPDDRQRPSGPVLYRRHLADDACTDVDLDPSGDAKFVLIDAETGWADFGDGGWRRPGGPLLVAGTDTPAAHGLDVLRSDGLTGVGRSSGLPSLGGLIRSGELDNVIDHSVAVVLPAAGLSAMPAFRWPASSADPTTAATYRGTDPAYALGTLLAIPPEVDLESLAWHTPQGLVLARAAQEHGWYVVDSTPDPVAKVAISTAAARHDLGLSVDPGTGVRRLDPEHVDAAGLEADVLQILHQVEAVVSNGR